MNIAGDNSVTDSPCVGVCSATALGDAVCRGCGRTFQEVIEWNTYGDQQKIEINRRLQAHSRPVSDTEAESIG